MLRSVYSRFSLGGTRVQVLFLGSRREGGEKEVGRIFFFEGKQVLGFSQTCG